MTNSSNKGAWLVRNSWGSNEYSHFGYFWRSYDEPSIYDRVYALDCVSDTGSSDDDFYDHNYQYDLSAYSQYGWIGEETSSAIANIFTATGTQLLKAVGVETQNPNINYTVNIYTDIANSSNPESGTLVRTQTGSFTYQGFHTIKMDNPLTLTKGETFSVVIKLESMDGKSGAYYVMESKYNLGNAASWYCGAEKGQSFIYGSGWYDTCERWGANVRIKAYTDDVQIQKPSAPSGLSVSNTIASLTLKWNAVTGATGYEVYRAGTDGKYSKIATVTSTSYVDTNVKNNTQYSYRIKAYNAAGTSAFSTAASLKKTQISVSNLKADATGNKVQLSWTGGVTGAEGYVIYRRTEGGNYTEIGRTSGNTYSDTIIAGIKYYYAVAVYSGSRTEDKCPEVGVMYLAEPAVTGASNITSGVQVKWSQVTGATGYIVYRKGAGKGWARIADIKDGSTVNYTDTTAASGTTYTYTVRAYNNDTMSDWNSTKSLMRISDTTLTGASNITLGVQVKWSQVTGATGYIVYRKSGSGSWGRIADIKSGSTVSYIDRTAASGTTYAYTVRAYNGSTMGDWHSTKSVKRLSDPKLTSASKVSGGIDVRWTKVTGATGYIVYRKSGSGSWGRIADIKNGSTVNYTDRTAKAGTTYTYTVRAYSGSTMGDWSSTITARR